MNILITGAQGFIGKNLIAHLDRLEGLKVVPFSREDSIKSLPMLVEAADFVFHLAGVNRPTDVEEFRTGNTDLTQALCDALALKASPTPVIYTSSIQASQDNPYGISKLKAEEALIRLRDQHSHPVFIFRLPNVFGKWAKPNYNSAVATFCNNVALGLPIKINDPSSVIQLVYVDDVIRKFIDLMNADTTDSGFIEVSPQYQITVGELASQLALFRDSRETMITEAVGVGLTRALYSTYLSYLPPSKFSYEVAQHTDPRGTFVEMLKTKDSGQFSFFTAHPGVTRGGHFHHTKNEKFLVIKGAACFRFRHIETGEFYELHTDDKKSVVVETVPGWTHDITNVGDDEMVVMLWANEIFDRELPDTFAMPVGNAS
jgi:UDP-2-acetamido-2,6-beta-L-arabino-hexul-4-ose reductase